MVRVRSGSPAGGRAALTVTQTAPSVPAPPAPGDGRVPLPGPDDGDRTRPDAIRVLLVEDDDGDALLVEELMRDSGEHIDLSRVATAADARRRAASAHCVVVDLNLPDAVGLEAVTAARQAAPDVAIVVLTGLDDRQRGVHALASGAQDYLVKGEVDGPALARAVRYAVERRRAEVDARRLLLAEQRQAENVRLARGLLPHLGLGLHGVTAATLYRPGGPDALLGGDFFDAVDMSDGTVRAVIGDVCGHGPDEAAIGVALRIAWRTLVLAGLPPDEVLRGVDAILRRERGGAETFATVCDVSVDTRSSTLTVRLQGHAPPLLLTPNPGWLEGAEPALPLGCLDHEPAPPFEAPLPDGWQVLLVTDGAYEGWAREPGGERLGMDGLARLAARVATSATRPEILLDEVLRQVTALHGGALGDDTALLWLGRSG